MPRPGTPLIHPGMAAAISAVAVPAQQGTCRILGVLPPRGPFDPETGQHTPAVRPELWTGSCRVQAQSRSQPRDTELAGQDLTVTGYQITVPLEAAVAGAEQVEILTSPDNALPGQLFDVIDVALGDLQAERLLVCELHR